MKENSKKDIILDYIKKHPKTTYSSIRKDTKLHPERYFEGLYEAFKQAGIQPPRTFQRKTKEEKRKLVIDYIKKHPNAGGQTIARDTKINLFSVFKNTKDAFGQAGIKYTRQSTARKKEEIEREIIRLIRINNLITNDEIQKKLNIRYYPHLKNIEKLCKKHNLKRIKRYELKVNKKKLKIIEFIKKNNIATQREINRRFGTKVQDIFEGGIFEAYKLAEVEYPFDRIKFHGIALKEIRERAKNFEEKVAIKLTGYGTVNRLVKTKTGIADIILERKGRKIPIEVKDYRRKDISITQVKQLNRYMNDVGETIGILICYQKPKKDRFIIGKNKLFILEVSEIDKIRKLI